MCFAAVDGAGCGRGLEQVLKPRFSRRSIADR